MIELDDASLVRLSDYAAEWTGFSRDAIMPDAIRRAARRLGGSAEVLLSRAAARDPAVVHDLCQAVSVGETFFFRHPEHFQFIASTLLPSLHSPEGMPLRAWSAGCATGEEAYSIAACLLDLLPARRIEVLGTDLLERNLAAARNGVYAAWSRRPSGPILHPLFFGEAQGSVTVSAQVRGLARFSLHNLLEPAPGSFELIFCRNVLIYFSPEAARVAVRHLVDALAPGGTLFLGPLDARELPPGLVLAGAPELQVFQRPAPAALPRSALPWQPAPPRQPVLLRHPAPPPAPLPTAPKSRPPEPVAVHLRALVHIERGEKKLAEQELIELTALAPDYLPGILERALLHSRLGERTAAAQLMREVLQRTQGLPAEQLLAGPEPLPVSFYRDSARSYLRGAPGISRP